MHHIGTITKTSKSREFHAQCSCGPAGDFPTKEEAASYLQGHFAKQGGVSTAELVDNSDQLQVETPVLPMTHATGAPLPLEGVEPTQGVDPTQVPSATPAEPETEWPKKKKK